MKKKAIFKLKEFPTPSETFIVNNIVAAIKDGYQVAIIADKIHPLKNSSQPEILKKYNLLSKASSFSLPKKSPKRFFKVLWLLCNPFYLYYLVSYSYIKRKVDLSTVLLLQFYRKFRKNEVFHVHFGYALYPLYILKRIGYLHSKIMVTFHGVDAFYLQNDKENSRLISFYNKEVSKITVNSMFLQHLLIEKGIEKKNIEIIHVGYNETLFTGGKDIRATNTLKLITIGRFIRLKGQEYGIRVAKLLIDKGYDVSYTLVGEGVEKQRLNALVKELKIEQSVIFTGKKDQSEIKTLLQESDLFLMTSTCDENGREEAFGVVSLEAQSMNVPVIGFASGGFSETILEGKTGFIVTDKDYVAMAKKVELLYCDRDKIGEMGKAAHAHVLEKFSKEKTINKYLNYY